MRVPYRSCRPLTAFLERNGVSKSIEPSGRDFESATRCGIVGSDRALNHPHCEETVFRQDSSKS